MACFIKEADLYHNSDTIKFMRSPKESHDTLTLTLPHPKGDLLRAQMALTHQAKNLYNTGLFLIRQVLTAYEYDKELETSSRKSELQPIQKDVIDCFNSQVAKINEKRINKHPAQVKKAQGLGKAAPELKLVASMNQVVSNPASIVLNPTVLDNAAREWGSRAEGGNVYRRLPGVMAQQVIKKLGENFSSYFQSLSRFNKSSQDMTGRPCLPGYLGKNERFVLEIPLANVHTYFPSIVKKSIPENYAETSLLSDEAKQAFGEYDVEAAIATACKKRRFKDFSPQCVRVIPMNKGVKMEVVIRVANAYPEQSFLAKLFKSHGSALAEIKTNKARESWLLDYLRSLPKDKIPRIASMDLGVNNLVTVAYGTGDKAAVHDGGRFEDAIKVFTDKIAVRISNITPARAKELQRKKDALQNEGKRLDMPEYIELNTILKELYADPEYRTLVAKKERWIKDYLHKTSKALVQQARERKIEVIVIGRNKGWKTDANMGAVQNRRFCQTAHATLITLIAYKAQQQGIAVVTTEESYTSKTSFVNGDELRVFGEKDNEDNSNSMTEDAASLVPAAHSSGRSKPTGTRSSDNRNMFVHKNRTDRFRVVHADVNGAFNIIRKVFKSFKYHLGLTLKYTIYRLSPRLGCVSVQILGFREVGDFSHSAKSL